MHLLSCLGELAGHLFDKLTVYQLITLTLVIHQQHLAPVATKHHRVGSPTLVAVFHLEQLPLGVYQRSFHGRRRCGEVASFDFKHQPSKRELSLEQQGDCGEEAVHGGSFACQRLKSL